MSGSIAELSPAGIYELAVDLRALGHKTGLGWLQLAGHLRRFGSIPSDPRSVASILGVTIQFMRERAWPLLEDRLTLSEDGRRYTCPDISPWNGRARAPASAPDSAPAKSTQQQQAANIGWAKRRERMREDAPAHARASEPHAETHDNSMRGTSETHAETHAVDAPIASFGASVASPIACATLSQQDSFLSNEDSASFSIPLENPGSERVDARASADAPGMRTDAPHDAPAHAVGMRKSNGSRKPSIPIPDDWKPNAEGEAECRKLGLDPETEATKFRLWNLSQGTERADWDATFLIWLTRDRGQQRQAPAPLVIPGGKADIPEPEADPASFIGPGIDAQWARVQRCVKKAVGGNMWRSWLAPVAFVGIDGDEVALSLPTPFTREHVRTHYGIYLTRAWQEENPDIHRVIFEVATERRAADG